MHRIRRPTMLALTAALVTATQAAAVPMPHWKFQEGDQQHYRLTHHLDAAQDLGAGGKAEYGVRITFDVTWHIVQAGNDGAGRIRQEVRRVQMNVRGPGEQSMRYDSDEEDSPRGFAARVAPLMNALLKSPLEATISERGEITEIVVPEELAELVRVGPGAKNLGNLATVEAFEKMLRQNVLVFPQRDELDADKPWSYESEVDLPTLGKLVAERTYEYVEERDLDGRTFAVFHPSVTLKLDANDGGDTVELDEQESSGEILFDRAAGRMQSSHLEQSLTVRIGAGDESAVQKIDQVIDFRWLKNPEEQEEDEN